MADDSMKILVCVEGGRTEITLINHLFLIYGLNDQYEIVSYKTNIFVLYQQMFENKNPEDMDLLMVLRENEVDPEVKKQFDIIYSDILLIFDMEPQDTLFSPEKLFRMQEYFSESDGNGKLYIN